MYNIDQKSKPPSPSEDCNELQTEQEMPKPQGTKSSRETNNHYFNEIVRVGRFRVIVCRDAIQWIIQQKDTTENSKSGVKWAAKSYHLERSSLMRGWVRKTKLTVPNDILQLPKRFPRITRPVR